MPNQQRGEDFHIWGTRLIIQLADNNATELVDENSQRTPPALSAQDLVT